MIVSESSLRDLIRLMVLKEGFEVDTLRRGSLTGKEGASSGDCEIKTTTTFPLNDDKTRILEIPEVKERFDRLRTELEAYLKNNGFDSAKIGDLGRSRALNDAADAGDNKARISGSLHGLSLAQDILIDVEFLGPEGTFKAKGYAAANAILAGNADFVKAINNFANTQADLTWGGTWGGSDPENGVVKGRGITEFHHFELKPTDIKQALISSGYDKHIKGLGFTVQDMLSNEKRSEMYSVLVGDECVDAEKVDSLTKKEEETQQKRRASAPSGYVPYTSATCSGTGKEWDGTYCNISDDEETIVVQYHKSGDPNDYFVGPDEETAVASDDETSDTSDA